MLMPENGRFYCADSECDFTTCDLFEFLDHSGVGYTWTIHLDEHYTFNFFQFLKTLSNLSDNKDFDGINEHVQSATLMMVNATGDDFPEFMEEAIVQTEMEGILKDVEGILKENE